MRSGNCLSQAPLKSRVHDRSMSSNIWIVRSICPSVVEWNAVLKRSNVPNASCNFCQKLEWNRVTRSDTMERCTPCNLTISLRYALASQLNVQVFWMDMKCTVLVSWSTTTHITLFFTWVRDRPTTKSIDTESHFHSGTSNGCNSHVGYWCSIFTLW